MCKKTKNYKERKYKVERVLIMVMVMFIMCFSPVSDKEDIGWIARQVECDINQAHVQNL